MKRTVSTIFAAALASAAPAQEVTVSLTHDDDDGVISIGETVTWALDVAFTGAELLGQVNLAIRADRSLGVSQLFEFGDGSSTQPFFRYNLDESQTSTGFESININNSLLLEAFGLGTASRDNPIRIGTFEFTALRSGELGYDFGLGRSEIDFVRLERGPTDWIPFATPDDVTLVNESLVIIPAPAPALLLGPASWFASRRRRSIPVIPQKG